MIGWILRLSIVLAAGVPALGFMLEGLRIGALCALVPGLLWLACDWQRWRWTASVGLILCTVLAVSGLTQGLPAAWMLVCLTAALMAWDLDGFRRTLEDQGEVQRAVLLQRQHLQRLLMVCLVGLGLGLVALQIRTRLTLGVALSLGLLAVLGLNRAISFLRRESG
jgi:uncharacterized membrane protein